MMAGRRTASAAALLAALLIASTAGATFAKAEMQVRLDRPVPRDAEPGSTIEVAWEIISVIASEERHEIGVSPFLRIVPPAAPGATASRAPGVEEPPGSGHYVASIVVPPGGIEHIEIGLVGEACDATRCWASDFLYPIVGPSVVGAYVPPTVPVPPAEPGLPALSALAVAVAVAVLAAAVITWLILVRRGRSQRPVDGLRDGTRASSPAIAMEDRSPI